MTNPGLIKHSIFNKIPTGAIILPFNDSTFALNQITFEFISLYRILISNKSLLKNSSEFAVYLQFLCDLLIRYYQQDYDKSQLHYFLERRKELVAIFNAEADIIENKQKSGFSPFIQNCIKNKLSYYATSFTSISTLRDCLASLNTNRSHWNYSRKVANHAITYFQDYGRPDFITTINERLSQHYSPQDLTTLLDKSRNTLRLLSVGLYAFRFVSHLILMIKQSTNALTNKELSSKKVIMQEIEKRGFTMISDLVWAITNALTAYKDAFKVSNNLASIIILSALIFDLVSFIVAWSFGSYKNHYFHHELMIQKNKDSISALERSVVSRQIDILSDDGKAQRAYYLINIVAASLLIIGFGASLITADRSFITLSAMNMLGNALYNSAVEYKRYEQSNVVFQREMQNGLVLNDALHRNLLIEFNHESKKAKTDFWVTLFSNTVRTAFFITACAISWPIALSLTVSYMAFRVQSAYEKSSQLNNNKLGEIRNIYRLFNTSELVIESQSNSAKSSVNASL